MHADSETDTSSARPLMSLDASHSGTEKFVTFRLSAIKNGWLLRQGKETEYLTDDA